jgi:hypothetical protein
MHKKKHKNKNNVAPSMGSLIQKECSLGQVLVEHHHKHALATPLLERTHLPALTYPMVHDWEGNTGEYSV